MRFHIKKFNGAKSGDRGEPMKSAHLGQSNGHQSFRWVRRNVPVFYLFKKITVLAIGSLLNELILVFEL